MAHRYRAGDDPEDIEYLVADFRGLRDEMRRRTKVIREIAEKYPELCPENKVTPELASRQAPRPAPDRDRDRRVPGRFRAPAVRRASWRRSATDLAKRGPALGIMLMLATQRPDAKSIPPASPRTRCCGCA